MRLLSFSAWVFVASAASSSMDVKRASAQVQPPSPAQPASTAQAELPPSPPGAAASATGQTPGAVPSPAVPPGPQQPAANVPEPGPATPPSYPAAPPVGQVAPPAPPGGVNPPQVTYGEGASPAPPAYYPDYPPPNARRRQRRRHREFVYGEPMPPGTRLPPRYRYVEGTPLPEGYHIEERANRGMVGGGAALLGVPYLIGAFAAISVRGDGRSGYLGIPIVGPWLVLGARQSKCGEIGEPDPGGFDCFMDGAGTGLLVASGVMQAVGAGLITLGLVNTREYAVADYARVRFTPVAMPTGGALFISGTL